MFLEPAPDIASDEYELPAQLPMRDALAARINPSTDVLIEMTVLLMPHSLVGLWPLNYSGSNWVAGEVGCVRNLSITCATSGAWPRL